MCTLFKPENQATNINSKKEEESFMKTFFSQEANINCSFNENLRDYLTKTQKNRNVDFEDVVIIVHDICKDIVRNAILSSDWTSSGIKKVLIDAGAKNVEITSFESGEYEIECEMEYIPNGKYVLSIPFFSYMNIYVSQNKSIECSFGASAFTIARDGGAEKWDTDVLYNTYKEHPENFDINLFFNCFDTNEEEIESSTMKQAAEIVDGTKEMFDSNLREKVENWVRCFDAIPQQLIIKAYFENNSGEFVEITPPRVGDKVYYEPNCRNGEIIGKNDYDDFVVGLDNGEVVEAIESKLEVCRYEVLPMYGTMWWVNNYSLLNWISDTENLQKMAECGFRVYESEEGIFFGIDGCGYDFYDYHWIPLYKAYVFGE